MDISRQINYKYAQNGNKIYAISTYAGRTVKGVAKCDPRDEFDIDRGKTLAAARCNQKVLAKRFTRAKGKVEEARRQMTEAQAYLDKMVAYFDDTVMRLNAATHEVEDMEKSF